MTRLEVFSELCGMTEAEYDTKNGQPQLGTEERGTWEAASPNLELGYIKY